MLSYKSFTIIELISFYETHFVTKLALEVEWTEKDIYQKCYATQVQINKKVLKNPGSEN